jgi:hypothetical protein
MGRLKVMVLMIEDATEVEACRCPFSVAVDDAPRGRVWN